MDVSIIACYYTDVHASGHGFYTVQSRNEAYKTVKISQNKFTVRPKGGGRSHHHPPPKYATDLESAIMNQDYLKLQEDVSKLESWAHGR